MFWTLWMLVGVALAGEGWMTPPEPVASLIETPMPPAVSLSPDGEHLALIERPTLPPLAELAGPVVKVAGLQIDPITRSPARAWTYDGLAFQTLERHNRATRVEVELPEGARLRSFLWSPDGRYLAFHRLTEEGTELWVAPVGQGEARQLTPPILNASLGQPCAWLPAEEGLICKVVPDGFSTPPAPPWVPEGPRIDESIGRQAAGRTWANLLEDAHDEALLEHFLTSAVVRVGLDGRQTPVHGPGLIETAAPSPDGGWIRIEMVQRPFSRSVPLSRFPRLIEVIRLDGKKRVKIAELPLADAIPITFGSTRTGRRSVQWRPDRPAELWWAEALDDGDSGQPAEYRDALYTLASPFDGEPELLWRSALRFSGARFTAEGDLLASSYVYDERRAQTWWLAKGEEPKLLWERSWQDAYSDPGSPLTTAGPYGRQVLRLNEEGALLFAGRGVHPGGVHPFLDQLDPRTGEKERLWQAQDPWLESVVDVLDGDRLITRRESAQEPPNYLLRTLGRARALPLTDFQDHAPQFARVQKQIIRYTRDDGLELSATVYLPPDYRPNSGPRPTLFWAYPSEFRSREDAAQVTATSQSFSRPWGASHLYFLLRGWIVVDDPTLPIVGEGDAKPNDTYVEQLVAGAEAAVEAVVQRGWADPERLVIGGHSYGAFTTANLLAHSDLFKAGIARSGAYNRTLTPFGFQGEQRSYWQAPETYHRMSPFMQAAQIDEPILLLHGAEDDNAGTWPMQSERFYEALKGLGGSVRYVELPHEGHGYRGRETVGHALWEMFTWAERWTEGPERVADPRR